MFILHGRHRRPPPHPFLYEREPSRFPTFALLLMILGGFSFFVLPGLLQRLGVGNTLRHTPGTLHVERGTVWVSLEGGERQRGESGLRLYAADQVETGGRSSAFLRFFEGTLVHMESDSVLAIEKSTAGAKHSLLALALERGKLWIRVPSREVFTGSVLRTLETPSFTLSLPPRTEALVTERGLSVFAAEGLGVDIELPRVSVTIGEGQKFLLPESADIGEDPYVHRSPLEMGTPTDFFVKESRERSRKLEKEKSDVAVQKTPSSVEDSDVMLTITQPGDGEVIATKTVVVSGNVVPPVKEVRVNTYPAPIATDGTFAQEIAVDADEAVLSVQALDEKGEILAELRRTVKRVIPTIGAPTILFPAGSGAVYRTRRTQFEIRGEAPPDAVGINVNDYRLQLFRPGDRTWSYLADVKSANIQWGRNVYEVRAIGSQGTQSAPVRITILLEEGEEGVVREGTPLRQGFVGQADEAEVETKEIEEVKGVKELLNNEPLEPGSLAITSPTNGEVYTATQEEFSIIGKTSRDTYSLWVNGYKLRLYQPGSPRWKYIASHKIGTMKRGKNVYEIVARNRKGEVLDRIEYSVTYRVR